jgi:hypothetical protein
MSVKTKDTQPAPDNDLLNLIRLGWAVAEVRGLVDRVVLSPDDERKATPTSGPDKQEKRGPLATDNVQSAADQLGWASKNLNSVAGRIRVKSAEIHKGNELPELPEEIEGVSSQLKAAIKYKGEVPEWRHNFVDKLIPWDEQVRDKLSSWGRRERSAYLFGRELAETYWCLDYEAEKDAPDSWSVLFHKDRVTRLKTELGQLGAAVDARRAGCLRASLDQWQAFVAHGDHHGKKDAAECLDRQAQMWQSLLEADTDLDGLRAPKTFFHGVGAGLSVVRVMWAQLIVLTGFTVLLAYGAWLLTQKQHDGFLSAIVAAVGAIGVTGSALTTKAKAEAVHLITNINAAVDSDLDAVATTIVPPSVRGRLRRLGYRLSYSGSRAQLSATVFLTVSAVSSDRRSELTLAGTAASAASPTQSASSANGSSTPSGSIPPAPPAGNESGAG